MSRAEMTGIHIPVDLQPVEQYSMKVGSSYTAITQQTPHQEGCVMRSTLLGCINLVILTRTQSRIRQAQSLKVILKCVKWHYKTPQSKKKILSANFRKRRGQITQGNGLKAWKLMETAKY